jgi:glycosyltransferase involved in cell wall biosynthesis
MTESIDEQPRVSVVIPVFCGSPEHEQFLTEALESVAAQDFRGFEVVIVDDVSPRDIVPIVEAVPNLPRTVILRNAANVGHAESRNIGVRAAGADLIAFLDHDDLWLPTKLSRQLAVSEANPDAAMVFCDMERFGPYADRLRIDQSIIPDRPSVYWFVCHGNYTISASAVLVRKQAMLDIDLFDSRYSTCDDFDGWLKILMRSPIVHLPETLARYRLHAANVNYGVDRLNDNRLLTALIWRYYQSAPPAEKLRLLPRLARKMVGRAYFTLRRYRRFG